LLSVSINDVHVIEDVEIKYRRNYSNYKDKGNENTNSHI